MPDSHRTEPEQGGQDVEQVEQALREKGILVRNMRGKPVIDGSFRLSIGTLEQMQQFMRAFAEVIG